MQPNQIKGMKIRMPIGIGRFLAAAGFVVSTLVGAACAQAQVQDYPNRPIKLVVGFPPGGSSDVMARLLAAALSAKLGQQVVVDNKPGANTIIATQFVRSQPADGYTLLSAPSSFAINPVLKQRNYDIFKDYTPVALVGIAQLLLVTPNEVPAKSVMELIAFAKAQQGKLSYASYGTGSAGHLASELLLSMTGVNMVHVPYKGGAPGLVDVVGGRVTMMMPSVAAAQALVKEGKVRALAVSSNRRAVAMPDVPTIAESGVPGFELVTWETIQAPAGTPPAIVDRLNKAIREVLATPELREKLLKLGIESESMMTPAEVATFIRREAGKFEKVVHESGIKEE